MSWKQFKFDVNRRKEALMIGAAVGIVAAYYVVSQGQNLNTIADAGKGLIDSVFTRSAPVDIAVYKVYGVFAFAGAAVGWLIDYILDVLKLRKRGR